MTLKKQTFQERQKYTNFQKKSIRIVETKLGTPKTLPFSFIRVSSFLWRAEGLIGCHLYCLLVNKNALVNPKNALVNPVQG